MTETEHDLIGIGFGPSNLALAIALRERGMPLDAIFLESQPQFAWHPGMMIAGADMQVSFLKDLVSLRNPGSDFSFLSYLHEKGRLERFINRKSFFPSRVEFNDYLSWAAGRLEPVCAYDQRVTAVEPVERHGRIVRLRLTSEDAAGRIRHRLTRQIVLAPGGQCHWPEPFAALKGSRALHHAADFMRILPEVQPGEHIAVIGAGQSASEVFAALAGHGTAPQVDLILRGHALKPADDSPFVNEIFDQAHTDQCFNMAPERRAQFLRDVALTNYAATDVDLLQQIYGMLYEQSVVGEQRLRLRGDSAISAAQATPSGFRLRLGGSGGDEWQDYDRVILCTGYRRSLSASLLAGLRPWMQSETPARDYRLPMQPGFGPAIFVQGYSEATHGLSDTLLSLLAIRADELARSVTGFYQHSDLAAE